MTDKLVEQIKAAREHLDDLPTIVGAYVRHRMPEISEASARDAAMFSIQRARVPDMEARILADAEVIKAAKELAEAMVKCQRIMENRQPDKMSDGVYMAETALAAFRQAQARAALEEKNDE